MKLIIFLLSIVAVIGGSVVLLLVAFMATRKKKANKANTRAVAPTPAAGVVDEQPELELIEEIDHLGPAPSIIVADDYEEEAQPVRSPAPEFVDDSFVNLFEDVPVVSVASMPWREKQQRKSRMANRLDRLTAPPADPSRPSSERTTRPQTPLPMPVAPAGVEPIPELEPTELIIDRPEWAAEWPY